MSTVRIVLLAAVGLLLLTGVAFGLSEALRAEADARAVVTQQVHRIVVRADTGDVEIRAGLTGDVLIARRDTWMLDRPSVTERLHRDGTLVIETRCGRLRSVFRCRADLMIDAPPEVDVTVRTSAGDVDLRGLSGRADVATDSGDIRAHRLEPVTTNVRTDEGNISLDLLGEPARTVARTGAGNVSVVVPFGPYRVDAVAQEGTVRIDGIIRDDLAPQAIDARTRAGNIAVRAR